ncbi:diaminopropionate ammonia-lyase [Streptomyces netropsis]|uniref:diaminopropionate ammonia-lyase n=1 Tax=Streptomyces netropsis TaxID=55404 RepID=UPI00379575FE
MHSDTSPRPALHPAGRRGTRPGPHPDAAWYARPAARSWTCRPAGHAAPAGPAVHGFHASLPGYAPTPLTEVPALAAELGVGRLFVKDESARLGLPAFKVLGASWAVHRAVSEYLGRPAPATLDALRAHLAGGSPVRLLTATDGNHGRAVAHLARLLGLSARIFVPDGVHTTAVAAIAAEGAEVVRVSGGYDAAVLRARESVAGPADIVVQDTAWPGYERIPGWVVEGYSTLFAEVDGQLRAASAGPLGVLAVPVGVGSLAQAAVVHHRSGAGPAAGGRAPALLTVEPDAAAGLLESLTAGALRTVPTGTTIMAGLNCGTPSPLAWPYLLRGVDAAIAVDDAATARAVRDLGDLGVPAGPCGAASLAGLRAALTGDGAGARRAALAADRDSTVVLLSTEGKDANQH